jgi:hypothetical protein
MRLSDRYTNFSGCTRSCGARSTVIPTSNRRTSKNKRNKNSICIHKIWGLESSRMGGIDTRVYEKVAVAKHTIKQNPTYLWQLWRYMRGWRTTRGCRGHSPTIGCAPKGLSFIHGSPGQNQVTHHRGQKMSLH